MDSKNSGTANREAIRRIFTDRRPYTVAEVGDLTKIDPEIVLREIASRELDEVPMANEPCLPWNEVAYLALRTWPLDLIFDALGSDASAYIPELLRPTTITVVLPSYQVRLLEMLARGQQLDVSTFLQLHLLDLASSVDQSLLEREIPGFIDAIRWPDV